MKIGTFNYLFIVQQSFYNNIIQLQWYSSFTKLKPCQIYQNQRWSGSRSIGEEGYDWDLIFTTLFDLVTRRGIECDFILIYSIILSSWFTWDNFGNLFSSLWWLEFRSLLLWLSGSILLFTAPFRVIGFIADLFL